METKEFLNTKLVNYASYDNLRKIASCIDGFKNAGRKVIYTVLNNSSKLKDYKKVLQLSNMCADYADYLHGSLDGVVVTLAQDFAGANNIPLLDKSGNFGTRSVQEASAPRYIFAKGSKNLTKLFKDEDDSILEKQTFEGNKIEPRFYLPSLPMLLVNGSEGVSSGFAQKIIGRNPANLKKYLLKKLQGTNPNQNTVNELLKPYYTGFNGTFEKDTETPNKWIVKGEVKLDKGNQYLITEIPYQYDLKQYLNILDDLQDNNKIIRYVDESDGENKLQFRVFVPRSLDINTNMIEYLKLSKPITENFTCIDENNKIIIFNNAQELFDHYIEIKKVYLEKRKLSLINKYVKELDILKSKLEFIARYICGSLIINKKSKQEIIDQLKTFSNIKELDNYSYLLNMPIHSLTKEKIQDLVAQIKDLEQILTVTKNASVESMWQDDLTKI